jgi:hypothetical protein
VARTHEVVGEAADDLVGLHGLAFSVLTCPDGSVQARRWGPVNGNGRGGVVLGGRGDRRAGVRPLPGALEPADRSEDPPARRRASVRRTGAPLEQVRQLLLAGLHPGADLGAERTQPGTQLAQTVGQVRADARRR